MAGILDPTEERIRLRPIAKQQTQAGDLFGKPHRERLRSSSINRDQKWSPSVYAEHPETSKAKEILGYENHHLALRDARRVIP